MSTMFRLLNEDGDIEIIENRPRIQYDTDLSKDGAIYDVDKYYQTKRHYNIYKMDKELLEKEQEIERLNNIINTMLDFNFFKEECPLNFEYTEKCDEEKAQDVFYEDDYCEENCNDDYKKCWLKYFERLQELKGSDK